METTDPTAYLTLAEISKLTRDTPSYALHTYARTEQDTKWALDAHIASEADEVKNLVTPQSYSGTPCEAVYLLVNGIEQLTGRTLNGFQKKCMTVEALREYIEAEILEAAEEAAEAGEPSWAWDEGDVLVIRAWLDITPYTLTLAVRHIKGLAIDTMHEQFTQMVDGNEDGRDIGRLIQTYWKEFVKKWHKSWKDDMRAPQKTLL